jgi:PadR family transcriptional regulator PadR
MTPMVFPYRKELLDLAGKEVALGSLYATLGRLEQKRLLESSLGEPTPERGGRANRYFHIRPAGLQAVRATRRVLTKLWSGLPVLEGRQL